MTLANNFSGGPLTAPGKAIVVGNVPRTPAVGAVPKRRAADIAFDTLETVIVTLQLEPGSPVVEADLAERTGLGRTPVREALLRMVSSGLIVQQPRRRGLLVSNIDLADHLDVVQTRRVLEGLIAACSARRATAKQRNSETAKQRNSERISCYARTR